MRHLDAERHLAESSKRLGVLDEHARQLRKEIAEMRAMQNVLASQHSIEERMKELNRADPHSEESKPENNGAAPKAVARAPGAREGKPRGGGGRRNSDVPLEFYDEIQEKVGQIRMLLNKLKHTERERRDSEVSVNEAKQRNENTEHEVEQLQQLVGSSSQPTTRATTSATPRRDGSVESNQTDGAQSKMGYGKLVGKLNAYKASLNVLAELYKERDLLQSQMQAQSAELRRLAMLLEEMTKAQEQKEEALAILEEKDARLAELRSERTHMQHQIGRGEHELHKPSRELSPDRQMRADHMDNRVALMNLTREKEQIERGDASIRHRALQIARLEKRLELIGDAVAGEDLADVERVDVELVDMLMREINSLHHLGDEANVKMNKLDAEVEQLDSRIAAFKRAMASTRREMDRIECEHARYLTAIQKEVAREQRLTQQEVAQVEGEIADLRIATQSRQGRNGRRSNNNRYASELC